MSDKENPIIKFTRKVVRNAGSLRITIPKEIADALQIEEGHSMEIYAQDSETLIVKKV